MSNVVIKNPRGEVPRIKPRLLPANFAQRARNCKLKSGALDPIKRPGLVLTNPGNVTIKTAKRYRHLINNILVDNWLTWGVDVNFVPSPNANSVEGRFYFTSDAFEPRMSTYAMAIGAPPYPTAWYALGVPSPTQKPTMTPSGGTAPTEQRTYVYTFVNNLGEESGTSPASDLVVGNINGAWALSNIQTAPPNSGTVVGAVADTPMDGQVTVELDTLFGLAAHEAVTFAGVAGMTSLNGTRRIVSINTATNEVVVSLDTAQVYTSGGTWTRESPLNTTGMVKRIYRATSNTNGYFFVGEIPVATTTFDDTTAVNAVGAPLSTLQTLPPPKNLTCITPLPNGCMVGLADNELCFSDPYKPYSWPIANRYSFSGKGVALVPAANSVIVLTDTYPILFTGSDPGLMSPSRIETYAPCMSKRGTVDVGGGCLYPSNDGLWLVSPTTIKKITDKLYTGDEWLALNPSSFDAGFFEGTYYAQYSIDGEKIRIITIDTMEPDGVVEIDDRFDSFYRNEYDGQMYVSVANRLYQWEGDETAQYDSDWMTKDYQFGAPGSFKVAQIFADFALTVPIDTSAQESNEALMAGVSMGGGHVAGLALCEAPVGGSLLQQLTVETQRRVQVSLYRDNQVIFTKLVTTSKPFRLPGKGKREVYAVQLSASVPVYSFAMASSMEELKRIAP